jgi:hypothetical protein
MSSLELMLRSFYYLVVLTIARRREPFANCNEIRVSLELIGENFTILPVTPVLLVVNKSPIWYVYPPSVMIFLFCLWWFAYLLSLTFFRGEVKYPSPPIYLIKDNEQ